MLYLFEIFYLLPIGIDPRVGRECDPMFSPSSTVGRGKWAIHADIRIWVTIYYAHSISVKVKLLSELLSETLFQYLKALSEFY